MENNKLEKQELEESLLGVRAGLSAISIIYDEVNEYKKRLREIETCNKELERVEEKIKQVQQLKEKAEKDENVTVKDGYCLGVVDSDYYHDHPNVSFTYPGGNSGTNEKWFVGGSIGCFIVLIASLILMIVGFASNSGDETAAGLIIGIITLIVFFIMHGVNKNKKTNQLEHYNYQKRKIISDCETYINELIKRKEVLKNAIKQKTAEILGLLNCVKTENNLTEICVEAENKIIVLKESAKLLAYGINGNYGNIISENDWENVDLILHYLQTGRADNLKEALYQVDRQRQNDTLVDAIYDSSASICSHIQKATHYLSEKIEKGFNGLRNSIESCIDRFISSNKNQNDRIENLLKEHLENDKMTSTLLSKSNCTSLELYEHYLLIQK